MPWEGFLHVIKLIFKMTNYKNAPFTVCSFWSMKTALRMKNASESSWFNEIVYPCCDELDFDLRSAATNSALVSVLLIRMPELYAVRHLSSFERGSVEVKLGEYILFDEIEDLSDTAELAAIGGRVIEIVQAFSIGEAVLRIRLDNARRTGAVDVERGGVFTVLESEQCIADPVRNFLYVMSKDLPSVSCMRGSRMAATLHVYLLGIPSHIYSPTSELSSDVFAKSSRYLLSPVLVMMFVMISESLLTSNESLLTS